MMGRVEPQLDGGDDVLADRSRALCCRGDPGARVIEPGDEQLVREAQAGNLRSFNTLVERHERSLYNLVLRHVSDRQLAEDVTQEAFISAWRAIHTFKGGSFKAWLFRIAVNKARDLYRSRSRRPASSLDDMLEQGVGLGYEADAGPGPEDAALNAATVSAVEQCLLRLPEEHRIVVLLSDVQGLTYDEVCQTLSLPLGTVKSRIFRARAALRKLLIESGELS